MSFSGLVLQPLLGNQPHFRPRRSGLVLVASGHDPQRTLATFNSQPTLDTLEPAP